jgi:DNA-binding HxlR family transcriptional regulator
LRLLGNGKLSAGFDADCDATRQILDRVGDKWSVFVVTLLGQGDARFNELKRTIDGISQRMLTRTLRGLERDGLVRRTVRPTKPPEVHYGLTDLGRTLLDPITALATWAQDHREDVYRAREAFARATERGDATD